MPAYKLPSGRWRAQLYDPEQGCNVSAGHVLGTGPAAYRTRRDALTAVRAAEERLGTNRSAVTVSQFRDRWLTDPLFTEGRKASTLINRADQTRRFAERYGATPMGMVGDEHVAGWLAAGNRPHTVKGLRVMWNAAASKAAGRIVTENPWTGLGLPRATGNRTADIPDLAMVDALIDSARHLCSPHYAAWIEVAAYTGMRPGELDGLQWQDVDFANGRITVRRQWSGKAGAFTTPKNGQVRQAILTPRAHDALAGLERDPSGFVFVSLRGGHFTPSKRTYHWRAVKARAGYDGTLYVATRHFAGWYMTNVLLLGAEDVAIALGHEDGGKLVRDLYGHRDIALALDRVAGAYEQARNVVALPNRDRTSA